MMIECQKAEFGSQRWRSRKSGPTPLRNEAPLNCVSLRSQLDCEVTCGVVKGQDERRPSAAPLTAPQVTPELLCSTEENKQGFTARRTKRGVLWVDRVASRRSCAILTQDFLWKCGESHKEQETEGPDVPNATKREIKQWRAATSALTFMTFS